ncbi:hypothetical protein ACF8OH_13500 [Delftia sp. WSY_9]|uniref:hypothetical protein n=1 Tax=unclassified Delftia TaxID=2613839 RepID=UPI00370BE82C
MAIITGNLERILLKYPEIDLTKVRLIGWGAGQYFHYQYPLIKDRLQLAYTVCPNPKNHGKTIMGLEVRSPESLHQECKENTIVVIFAERYFDIMHALRDRFNDLRSVNACTLEVNDGALLTEMDDFRNLNITPIQRKWKSRARFGIFIQGMAMAHTPYVLAWNRMHHPHAYQCMVTWDHLDPALLERCRAWVDKLILVPQPENTGILFLNTALRSARIGVEHLAEQGIEFSVRCRSDNILAGSLNEVVERHFSRERNHGKIAISIHSWPHLPFMFSEKTMLARTTDMLKLWSMPEDPRSTEHLDYQVPSNAHFLELKRAVPEVLLWSSYAKSLGYSTDTLEDSHNFQRACLLPLEPNLRWQSLKFIPLFHIIAQRDRWWNIEQWEKIYTDPESAREHAQALQNLDMSVEDFWQQKVG